MLRSLTVTVIAALAVTAAITAQTIESALAAETAPAQSSGPSVIEVPLEDSLEVRPAVGWLFADCDALLAASALVTQCSSESFTVTGPAYDSEISPVRVPMRLIHDGSELTIDYLIRLAEPTPPDAPDTSLALPLTAGAVALIPFSDLGLDCGLCSAGTSTIEVRAVEPASAGIARVTGRHLVFSAAPQARGAVEIDLSVRDDIGASSKVFRVTGNVSDGTTSNGVESTRPLVGVHVLLEAGATSITDDTLVLQPASNDRVVLAGCGTPLHGTVRCTRSGSIDYQPPAGAEAAPADQFSVRFVTADGRHALASVTLGSDASSGEVPRVAPAAGATVAVLALTLPKPVSEDEESASGATTGFSAVLDTLGAR